MPSTYETPQKNFLCRASRTPRPLRDLRPTASGRSAAGGPKAPRCSQRNGPLSFAPLSPPVFGRFPDLAILGSEFPSNPVISERAVGMQMDTEITRNPRKQPGQYGCVREPPEYSGAKLNENSGR